MDDKYTIICVCTFYRKDIKDNIGYGLGDDEKIRSLS